ncbi:LLM class flavin-dependent oxidoreductase [Streptomyces sp. NPDC006923]|uniref:LLM class flavin-dependent oxidoreductase n=1 Tax=Streptomyces sp. NPDC006923 TaxID=3155355 RepID=UPI0033D643A5
MSALRPLHLAAEIGGPPEYAAAPYVELARLAEYGALDFVTLRDSFARPGPDALAVLARVAPATERIGLVPAVTTTHTEPFHLSTALATLDWVSRGRAGWLVDVSDTPAQARLFGHRPAAPAEDLWQEAGEIADAAARLWDGREDGAGIRATATGRRTGREEPRPAGSEGAGSPVRGRSAVPRPPQGHPVTVVDVTGGHSVGTAARYADVVLVGATAPERIGAVREELRSRAAGHGRDPDTLRVLASLTIDLSGGERPAEPGLESASRTTAGAGGPHYRGGPVELAELITAWHRTGAVDGFHLTPAEPRRDLERLVNGTVALLQHRSRFRTFHPGGTLREHLGLGRPAGQYTLAGGTA